MVVNAFHSLLRRHLPELDGLHSSLPLGRLHSMAGLAVVEGNGRGGSPRQGGFQGVRQARVQAAPLGKGNQIVRHITGQDL